MHSLGLSPLRYSKQHTCIAIQNVQPMNTMEDYSYDATFMHSLTQSFSQSTPPIGGLKLLPRLSAFPRTDFLVDENCKFLEIDCLLDTW